MSADAQLRAFIDRILRLKEEQDTLADDIKEVYAEAKGGGYDKTAMGQVVSYLRKRGQDAAKLEEQSAIFDLYLSSYDGPVNVAVSATHTPAYARTRENITQFPTSKGESDAKSASSDRNPDDLIVGRRQAPKEAERQPPVETIQDETPAESVADEISAPILQSSEPTPSQAETTATDAPPPASVATPFLAKASGTMQDDRPHCQNPSACGAYKRGHCYTCAKAAGLNEAAA